MFLNNAFFLRHCLRFLTVETLVKATDGEVG